MRSRYAGLIEASLLTTIMVVLFLLVYYQPFFFLLSLVWAVPLAVLTARQGMRYGLMSSLCTMALLGLYTSYLTWPAIVPTLALNFMVGWGLHRDWKPVKFWVSTTVVGILGTIVSVALTLYTAGLTDLGNIYPQLLEWSKTYTMELYDMGLLGNNLAEVQSRGEVIVKQILMALPASVLLAGIFYAASSYYVTGLILKRLGGFHRVNTLPPLRTWSFTVFFAYLYAFGMLGYYWGGKMDLLWLSTVSLNAMEVANLVGAVQAMALLAFFKYHGKIPKKLLVVLGVLCAINPALLNILSLVGFMDMVFNYRKKFQLE